MKKIAIVIILVAFVLPLLLLVSFSSTPVVDWPSTVSAVGQSTPIPIHVHDPHGIREVKLFIEQDGVRYKAADILEPARHIFWLHDVSDQTLTLVAGTKTIPQLKDGKAKLIAEVTSNDFRRLGHAGGSRHQCGDRAALAQRRFRPALPLFGHGRPGEIQRLRLLDGSGSAGRQSDFSRVADAGGQARPVFALRLCLEYASLDGAGRLRH